MVIFDRYALYYELLYADKNYALEARFVEKKFLSYAPRAKSIVDLGCGNARHTIQFAEAGYTVKGVDFSPSMLNLAQTAVARMTESARRRVTLACADVSNAMNLGTFDVAISLFHVVNYQASDESLLGFFKTARGALKPGGVFIFDFWYGPAVLHDKPEKRVKSLGNDRIRIVRTATPQLDVERHIVTVHYDVAIADGSGPESSHIHESHIMRYLFAPEIERYASQQGFKVERMGKWMTDESLSVSAWYGYAVLVAN